MSNSQRAEMATKITEALGFIGADLHTAKAVADVMVELNAATQANEPMNSLHEAKAVIDEEVFEFTLEVYKNPRKHPDRDALARKEAVQIAAMAIRCIVDVL